MHSVNGAPLPGETLRMIRERDYPGEGEIAHIDSGSRDGTMIRFASQRNAAAVCGFCALT